MDKREVLEKISKEIENCKTCKIGKIGKAVPGEGSPDAKIMFVGEAPGKLEAETGRPFVGRSGKLLRKMIAEVGLSEDEVYITSPVKYLPKRGTPLPSDILHGKIHFDKQVDVINPKIIVVLGSVAAFAILNEKIPILKMHGKALNFNPSTGSGSMRKVFITFHPSYILRFQRDLPAFKKDFVKIKKLINEKN